MRFRITHAREFEFWYVQKGRDDTRLGELVIIETVTVKDAKPFYYWAFGEGCDLLLCTDTPEEVFFTFAELVELRKPIPKHEFLGKCKKKQLQFVETDGEPPRFARSKTGLRSGRDGWTPRGAAEDQAATGSALLDNVSPPEGQQVPSDKAAQPQEEQHPAVDGNPG